MASSVLKNLISVFEYWPLFFLSFVFIGLVAPSLPVWALCFYVLFIPRFLFEIYRNGSLLLGGALFLPQFFLGICFLWVGILSCFFSLVGHQSWRWAIDFTCTLTFLWGAWEAMRRDPQFLEKILAVVAWGGSLNALISLILGAMGRNIDHYAPARMAGWGIFHSVVFAGDLAGLGLLSLIFLLFFRFTEKDFFQKRDLFHALLFVFNGLFLFLTGCRMAWVSLFVALLMFLSWKKQVICFVLIGFLASVCFLSPEISPYFLERADSGHLQIWQNTFETFSPYLIFGEGMQMKMSVPDGTGDFFSHPHSFYLSLLIQGGIVGLAAFLLSGISLFFRGIKSLKNRKILAFAVYALCCGLTDLSFVFKGPSEEWILIWLPFLMTFFCLWKESEEENKLKNRAG